MKKILVFMLAALFALSCVLLVACNATVQSIEIVGAPSEVERNAVIDYSKISVVATLDDGTTTDPIPLTDKSVRYNAIDRIKSRSQGDKRRLSRHCKCHIRSVEHG